MIHDAHPRTDAKPQRRVPRIALVVASTTLISGGVIFPASAATPALSHSTAAPTVVTDVVVWSDAGGEGHSSDGIPVADPIGTVSPKTVRPGQTVHLTLRNCSNPSEGGLAEGSLVGGETTARSPIGITYLEPDADGTLVGTAPITNVKPGTTETIYFVCFSDQNKVAEATVTITR